MTPVQEHVLQRFARLYGAPETTDIPKFTGEYVKALGRVGAQRLEAAIDRVVSANRFRIWPTPGDCVAAVQAVSHDQAREREFANYEPADWRREPTKAEKARVWDMTASCKESLAAKAAELGRSNLISRG